MSISFSNAPGNLYNRLGRLGKIISAADAFQDAQTTNILGTNGAIPQYDSEPDIQALLGSPYIGILNSPGDTMGGYVQPVAASIISRMVFRDNPLYSQTLTQQQTLGSIIEVIRQMKLAGASVLAQTITATPVLFTNTVTNIGNGIVNASVRRPFDGLVLENSIAETAVITCTDDSYNGNAIAGNEPLTLNGVGAETDLFAFDWPLGSNFNISVNAIDGNADNSSGNLLTNSGYESWTGNVPDNFVIVVGASTITKETTIVYDGAASLQLTGDGATLTEWTQLFDDSTGTLGTLTAQTQYSYNVFTRRDGVNPAAGVLTVDLIDQNGNVIQDAGGNNNSFTIDLTALTTEFASRTGAFRTPVILPTTVRLRHRLTTPLTNNRAVYFDKMSLGVMSQGYIYGPFFAVHAGSTPFLTGDNTTCVITNSRGAAGTFDTWQTLFSRLYPDACFGNGILLPSSSVPTISDLLITS